MTYMTSPELIERAFSGGTVDAGEIALTFRTEAVGHLRIESGHIVACDPLANPGVEPFTRGVPPGEHPVSLAIAVVEGSGDERIAFARVDFVAAVKATDIGSWEMAHYAGQNPKTLEDGEVFGYCVDAGTGCFMDLPTARRLTERMAEDPTYYETIMALLHAAYKDTREWASFEPTSGDGGNVVAFSTGYGDGVYASYFALDHQGRPLSLITDFAVVGDPEDDGSCELPAPKEPSISTSAKKPWWKFW